MRIQRQKNWRMVVGQALVKFDIRRGFRGQAMLVAVIFISGLIVSATTIAGLLTVYQIRQVIDAESSARAIFAADTGIEASLDCYFHMPGVGVDNIDKCVVDDVLGNGAKYRTELRFKGNLPDIEGFYVTSYGSYGSGDKEIERVLQTFFEIR